jgi:hypothetical protein
VVGNGKETKFWTNVWLDVVPLKLSYYELFQVSSDPNALVADMEEDGTWLVQFRRELNMNQIELWRSLFDMLRRLTITVENDIIAWLWRSVGFCAGI